MEQRRLRLGDIVDDYCPRERRVTNHAVVAMVEEDVKQTRCTTCDTEHPYKGGKAPRRRKKDTTGALYKEVLAGLTDGEAAARRRRRRPRRSPAPVVECRRFKPVMPRTAMVRCSSHTPEPRSIEALSRSPSSDDAADRRWSGAPPLIRATLPRLEGHKEERQGAPISRSASLPGAARQFQNNTVAAPTRARVRATVRATARGSPSNRPHGARRPLRRCATGAAGARRVARGRPQQGGGFRGGQPQGRTDRQRERQRRARRRPQAVPLIVHPEAPAATAHVPYRKDRPHRRRRQQALDRLGDRAGRGGSGRATRGHLSG